MIDTPGPAAAGRPPAANVGRQFWLFAVPFAYGLAAAAFFVLRPAGRWSEHDTATLTEAIAGMLRAQQLVPGDGTAYSNGYAYQAVAVFLLAFTGLPLSTFQQLLSPFLLVLVLLPVAWAAYRELTGGRAATATLATVLLLLQPEFLFVTLRGSHEKITRMLLLLALLLLARSLRLSQQPRRFAVHVPLFYLVGYGIIASNSFFGTSFIAALVVALFAGRLLSRRWGRDSAPAGGELTRRLLYSAIVLLGLAFVFTFYAYPPASNQLAAYQEIWKKVTVLLLDVAAEQAPAGDPYGFVVAGWISLPVYFIVSLANWLLIVASLVFWLRDGWRWFVRGETPSPSAWLLWLLFAAFAVQGALSVAFDLSGAIGSNFQHRAFASFALVAVAVAARGAMPLLIAPAGAARIARGGLAVLVGCLAVLSPLKATNEPLLSNKWMFYKAEELQALRWATASLRYATISADFDERLTTAYLAEVGAGVAPRERVIRGNRVAPYFWGASGRDFLVSDVTRLRAARLGFPLPPVTDQIRVYDNGVAQLYHLVPVTPYQR